MILLPEIADVTAALEVCRTLAAGPHAGTAAVARRLHEVRIAAGQVVQSTSEAQLAVRLEGCRYRILD